MRRWNLNLILLTAVAGLLSCGRTKTTSENQLPTQLHRVSAAMCPPEQQPQSSFANQYTHCRSDADCKTSEACTCDGTKFAWAHQSVGNVCVPAQCHQDSDCGQHVCSPSAGFDAAFYGVAGFYCHTSEDECTVDADCTQQHTLGTACSFNPAIKHWVCSYSSPAG
jgi:hypothetical protein